MACCGIDFGSLSSLVAQSTHGAVDVVLNDSSNRQSASCISFNGKQRFFGDSALALV